MDLHSADAAAIEQEWIVLKKRIADATARVAGLKSTLVDNYKRGKRLDASCREVRRLVAELWSNVTVADRGAEYTRLSSVLGGEGVSTGARKEFNNPRSFFGFAERLAGRSVASNAAIRYASALEILAHEIRSPTPLSSDELNAEIQRRNDEIKLNLETAVTDHLSL